MNARLRQPANENVDGSNANTRRVKMDRLKLASIDVLLLADFRVVEVGTPT